MGESFGNGLGFVVSATERFPPGVWSWLLWLRAVSQSDQTASGFLVHVSHPPSLQAAFSKRCGRHCASPLGSCGDPSMELRFSVSLQGFPHLPLMLAVFACRWQGQTSRRAAACCGCYLGACNAGRIRDTAASALSAASPGGVLPALHLRDREARAATCLPSTAAPALWLG